MNKHDTSEGEFSAAQLVAKKQSRGITFTIVAVVVFITLVMVMFLNKITTPRILGVLELRANGTLVFEQPRIFKDFKLSDQNGKEFSKAQFENKWSLVFFGFTACPDVCPTTLSLMKQVKQQLNPEIAEQMQFIMVSVDPARDTVATLSEYMPYFDPEFIGLTGEFLQVKRLATQLNAAFVKVKTGDAIDDYTVDHSANVAIINPYGDYHGFIKAPLDKGRIKLTMQSIITMFER